MESSNPCLEYTDVYGRKTDLMHVSSGATYPINILGNAATADVANNPIEDLLPDSTDTISFRSGDELDEKTNEFTHKISKVEEAVKATNDSNDENIAETYARKEDVVTLDPETGKISLDLLPDTQHNVNFVNGKTGDVTLYGTDIKLTENTSTTITEKIDAVVEDVNTAISGLNDSKQDKFEVGQELYTYTDTSVNAGPTILDAYSYSANQTGNTFQLKKKNVATEEETVVSSFNINANANFAFAAEGDIATTTGTRIDLNFDNAVNYNLCYIKKQDVSTGTWTLTNQGDTNLYVMRFGGRFGSGARISPMPDGFYLGRLQSITFYVDSDDPYLDRNSFGLLIWKVNS